MRRRVLRLSDARAYIEDTSAFSIWHTKDAGEIRRRQRLFADVMDKSVFVLCPRGAGTSSYRLFETMEAERAPVVIADEWVEPFGADWSFLVRVAERDVAHVPEILRAIEPEARDRARAARAAWEAWYAPEVVFHHAIEAIATLRAMPRVPETLRHVLPDPEYVRVRVWEAIEHHVRRLRDRGYVTVRRRTSGSRFSHDAVEEAPPNGRA